jgi:AraC-like DNA-binding protein
MATAAPASPDFASALMLRVLAAGMRQLGLTPPDGLEPQPGTPAHVGLADKRRLVGAAIEQGGLAVLVKLGCGLPAVAGEPLHQALTSAVSVEAALQRWRRLERYIHSRHRILLEDIHEGTEGGHAVLTHTARQGPAPLPAEDLVVLGVLAAMLGALGVSGVRAWVGGEAVLPGCEAGRLGQVVGQGLSAQWRLAWEGAVQPPAAGEPSGLALLADGSGWAPDGHSGVAGAHAWPAAVQAVANRLATSLSQPPTWAALAHAIGRSPRSLQRDLSAVGLSHSSLLGWLRTRAAGRLLMDGALSVAEIGFVCGYTDQPHFTRDFRRRVGLPPAAFRASFRRAG